MQKMFYSYFLIAIFVIVPSQIISMDADELFIPTTSTITTTAETSSSSSSDTDEDIPPIIEAMRLKDLNRVKEAISRGADPKAVANNGETVLHIAAAQGNIALILFFLKEHRIDPNIRARNGNTALHNAVKKGNIEIAEALVIEGYGVLPRYKHTNSITYLARVTANTIKRLKANDGRAKGDIKNNEGDTPMDLAIKKGCVQMVSTLLRGKNVNYGWHSIYAGIDNNNMALLAKLNFRREVALNHAIKTNNSLAVHNFLSQGAQVDKDMILAAEDNGIRKELLDKFERQIREEERKKSNDSGSDVNW